MIRFVLLTYIVCLALIGGVQTSLAASTILHVWDWWNPNTPNTATWFRWVEQEFEKANPDIDIEYTFYQWGEYLERLAIAYVSGSPPDVIQLPVGWGRELHEQGVLLNLSGYVSHSQEHNLRNYVPIAREYVTAPGAQFGIPFVFDATSLVYNRRLLSEAGYHVDALRSIATWETFVQMARKLTHRNESGITQSGYNFSMGLEVFTSWLASNGASIYTADHKGTNLTSPAAIQTLTHLRDLINVHNVNATNVLNFGTGEAAIISLGTWAGLSLARDWPQSDFGMSAFPPGPSTKKQGLVGWTNMLAIPKFVENSDAAWRYVAFCTGSKAQTKLGSIRAKDTPARLDYYQTTQFNEMVKVNRWMLVLPEAVALANPIIFFRTMQINAVADQLFAAVLNDKLAPTEALTQLDMTIRTAWR